MEVLLSCCGLQQQVYTKQKLYTILFQNLKKVILIVLNKSSKQLQLACGHNHILSVLHVHKAEANYKVGTSYQILSYDLVSV